MPAKAAPTKPAPAAKPAAKSAAAPKPAAKAAPTPKPAGKKVAAAKPAPKAAPATAGKKTPLPKATGKKAPLGKKPAAKTAAKQAVVAKPPGHPSTPKVFRVGQDLPTKGLADLSRFTRWPAYVWRQRRVRILQKRLKVPPSINQFSRTLDSDIRKEIFRFAQKYQPESKKERAQRLKAIAAAKTTKGKDTKIPEKRPSIRTGLKCITRLVEQKKAKLVLIAHDVVPLELVIFLPTLCRKQGVPYAIVKGKALLGKLAGFKEAAALAFDTVTDADAPVFAKILESLANKYRPGVDETRKNWGGLRLGRASQDKLRIAKVRAERHAAAIAAAIKS